MANESGRDPGFLTEKNREQLRGNRPDASRQNKSHHRGQIRKGLRNALLDFSIVFDHMDDDELQKVLGEYTGPSRIEWKDDAIARGMRDTLAFVLREAGTETDLIGAAPRQDIAYKELLYDSLQRIGAEKDVVVHDVELKTETDRINIHNLKQKLEREGRDALTYAEIGVLAAEGELPDDF